MVSILLLEGNISYLSSTTEIKTWLHCDHKYEFTDNIRTSQETQQVSILSTSLLVQFKENIAVVLRIIWDINTICGKDIELF